MSSEPRPTHPRTVAIETFAPRRELRGRRILVTGASGFVGTHVLPALGARGAVVRALVRPGREAPGAPEVALWDGLHDRVALARALEGVDAVVHLAARVHVLRDTSPDPADAFRQANVDGTRNLLDAMDAGGVERLVFLSTVAATAFLAGGRIDAGSASEPDTPYGRSKLEAERLIETFAGTRPSARAAIVRPPGVYGPGMPGRLDQLFRMLLRGVPVPVVPGVRRSFLYVGNLAALVVHLLETFPRGVSRWLTADGPPLETVEFIRLAAASMGVPGRILPLPPRVLRLAGRIGDGVDRLLPWPLTSAAVSRVTADLEVDWTEVERRGGFSLPFSTEHGVGATGAWYRGNGPPEPEPLHEPEPLPVERTGT